MKIQKQSGLSLLKKIQNRKACVAVMGLGYVGLPLAMEFARAGFEVLGVDVDVVKINAIRSGRSYITDIPAEEIRRSIKQDRFKAFSEFAVLSRADVVIICVPTPLAKGKDPDLTYIFSAVNGLKKHLHSEQLVVLESTTYPGTTGEIVLPILLETGMNIGSDFFLAFSPERVDPSNPQYKIKNTPKVVGGMTPFCTRLAKELYGSIVDQVVEVSSTRVAEMVKLVENTFRSVNIALVNELCIMCQKLKIDLWEVIDAAKTKPYGFMPFYPGPGLGGHCIPIDPFYLTWKARLFGFNARLIELAGEINHRMPGFVAYRTQDLLNARGKTIKNAKVAILGVTYKRDVNDVRESPAFDVIEILEEKGAKISYYDPYVPQMTIRKKTYKAMRLTSHFLKNADIVVILTDHRAVDYGYVFKNAKLILDTRNALKGFKSPHCARL